MNMLDKVIDLMKSKDIIIPRILLYKYKDLGLEDKELIVIIYLLNMVNSLYNPKKISEHLNMNLKEVIIIMDNLSEKGILKTEMIQRNNKKFEVVNLDQLYNKLGFMLINEKESVNTSIYAKFENEFGRSLASTELDLIDSWRKSGISDEVIEEALKEAVINNVSNLKYIDTILLNWTKKGVKTKDDVEKQRKKFREQKSTVKKEVTVYNWLDEDE